MKVHDSTMPELYTLVSRWTRGRKALAEDIVQETYLRALRSWDRRGLPADPGAWLRTVARNLLISHIRKARVVSIESVPPPADGFVAPENPTDSRILRRALAQLRRSYRLVIEGFHLQGKTMREIAQEENTTARAVEGRLRRARRQLGKLLGVNPAGKRGEHGQRE